jgi:acetolactate synthase II small subunit
MSGAALLCVLELELHAAEGALVRVLGLVERRGYRAVGVTARSAGDALLLSLTLRSARPVEPLLRQLEKLYDVRRAVVASAPPVSGSALR